MTGDLKCDYSKLLGRIVEKYGTQFNFAKILGISERSLSLKLNSKVGFKQSEIVKSCELLGIEDVEIAEYFFVIKVQKIEQNGLKGA